MYDGGLSIFYLIGLLFTLWPIWLIIFLIWLGKRSDKKYQQNQVSYQPAAATYQPPADLIDRDKLIDQLERQLAEARQSQDLSWQIGGLEEALRITRAYGSQPSWDLPAINSTNQVVAQAATPVAPAYQPAQKTDNALTLLYLGAFLFIAAIALFVWLAGLDGITKTFLIILTAGLMYGGGLQLHAMSPSLRAAAPTFLAMGIGTLPFAGLAMNRYLSVDGGLSWMLVSVIALAMSIYAVNVAKAQVVGYFTAFAWLSLLASSLTIVDAPIYMYMWALIAGSILLRLYLEYSSKIPGDDHVPFENTVQTAVPLAVLGSLVTGGTSLELWHIAVTILLSAAYYLMLTRYSQEPTRSTYAAIAHLLAVIATVLMVIDFGNNDLPAIGLTLGIFAVIQLIAITSNLFYRLGDTGYRKLLYGLTAVLPLLAVVFFLEDREWLISGLVVAVLVCIGLLRRSYSNAAGLPLVVAVLALPFAIGWYQLDEAIPPTGMLALFLIAAVALWLPRRLSENPRLNPIWRLGYLVALAFGLLWMLFTGTSLEVAWTCLLYAVVAIAIGAYEKYPNSLVAVPLLLAVSAERFLSSLTFSQTDSNLALAAFGIGAASYAASYAAAVELGEDRRRALGYSGIAVLFMAWPLSWGAESLPDLFGPTALLLASITVYLEARRGVRLLGGELIGLAGMMLAFQLGLNVLSDGKADSLIYSHLWAAYLAFAYFRVKRSGDAQNAVILKYFALLVLTVPTAFKALDDSTGAYGLLLLAEHVLLAVVGEMLKKRELVKWGVSVTVLTLVYMLRDFTFLNIGFIAILLIGYSIFRLSKANNDNH